MGENSKIEWCHHTFNPWRGCTRVSEGCRFCYAETMSHRNPGTLGVWGPQGTRVVAAESYWRQPLKWDRQAERDGVRRRVFCASLADVFEDNPVPPVNAAGDYLLLCDECGKWHVDNAASRDESCECGRFKQRMEWLTLDGVRARLFDIIHRTPNLNWLLLTKRPKNVLRLTRNACEMLRLEDAGEPNVLDCADFAAAFPNVWLGTSVENQAAADERIPVLLSIPAAVRFLSMEPLLGPVDFDRQCPANCTGECGHFDPYRLLGSDAHKSTIDWVIVGGESGRQARPCDIAWVRSIRDQCRAAGVPVFVKQLGSHTVGPDPDSIIDIRDSKGGDPSEWTEDLRVRELPQAQG